MRIDLLLLALLFSTLAFTPCADMHAESVAAEVGHFDDNASDDPCENTDHCTPFCVCSCCGALSVQLVAPVQLELYVSLPKPRQRAMFEPNIIGSNFPAKAWQPPRA